MYRGKILYIESFTVLDGPSASPSSDAVGYGITASRAIKRGLRSLGYDVRCPRITVPTTIGEVEFRNRWILGNYISILDIVSSDPPDLIFCFHSFGVFPTEIRRILLDLGKSIPIIGYTHGSHWDPSDGFRSDRYPGLEIADLANLHVMDRILLVSEYIKDTLAQGFSTLSGLLSRALSAKMVVVGLPIDTDEVDLYRDSDSYDRTTVVYNHAPLDSKGADLFLDAIRDLMPKYDINILLTRRFPHTVNLKYLLNVYDERVICGDDLLLDEYYRSLWMSDIQVSTAMHESLGISTLEAMYTQNYCIAPQIGSYPEIFGEQYAGLYDRSRAGLLERLQHALENPEYRVNVARCLPNLVTRRYSTERVVERIAEVIDSTL